MKDAGSGLAAIKEALTLRNDRNLHQIVGSRITRIGADGGGEFKNQKLKNLCFDKSMNLSLPAHSHHRMALLRTWLECSRPQFEDF